MANFSISGQIPHTQAHTRARTHAQTHADTQNTDEQAVKNIIIFIVLRYGIRRRAVIPRSGHEPTGKGKNECRSFSGIRDAHRRSTKPWVIGIEN